MIGLITNYMVGSMIQGPCVIIASICAMFAICGCVKCAKCRIRDCACCKRFFRLVGKDEFDDFELMMLVHEVIFESASKNMATVVRVTAGSHHVKTDPSSASNGIFQQPLNICVEQGTESIVVELLDTGNRLLATVVLDPVSDVLGTPAHQSERFFAMKQKGKGVRNPKIKLTLQKSAQGDEEEGLLSGEQSDIGNLVKMHLGKARAEGKAFGEAGSELDVLRYACAGPLELFEGLGKTSNVYVAIRGPPTTKQWILGIWPDKKAAEAKGPAMKEVHILRIQAVQPDLSRHNVFEIHYFDESRLKQSLTFRRVDRARDVWAEVLHLMVEKVHENRRAKGQNVSKTESKPKKKEKKTGSGWFGR